MDETNFPQIFLTFQWINKGGNRLLIETDGNLDIEHLTLLSQLHNHHILPTE